jgi:hypothetical protein
MKSRAVGQLSDANRLYQDIAKEFLGCMERVTMEIKIQKAKRIGVSRSRSEDDVIPVLGRNGCSVNFSAPKTRRLVKTMSRLSRLVMVVRSEPTVNVAYKREQV